MTTAPANRIGIASRNDHRMSTAPSDHDLIRRDQYDDGGIGIEPSGSNLDAASEKQEYQMWTAEPQRLEFQSFTEYFEALTEWGRKYFGEDWYEKRKLMIEDVHSTDCAMPPRRDPSYLERQQELRKIEAERQEGKLPRRGKTLEEVKRWAQSHYGQKWLLHKRAANRDLELSLAAETEKEQIKYGFRSTKRSDLSLKLREQRDLHMLLSGYSWDQIMEDEGEDDIQNDDEASTPYMSDPPEDWDGGSPVLQPRTNAHLEARAGPECPMLHLQWSVVRWHFFTITTEQYEEARREIILRERSKAEDKKCEDRWFDQDMDISAAGYEENYEAEEAAKKVDDEIMALVRLRQEHGFTDAEAREYRAQQKDREQTEAAHDSSVVENEEYGNIPLQPAAEPVAETTVATASGPSSPITRRGPAGPAGKGRTERGRANHLKDLRQGERQSRRIRKWGVEFEKLDDPDEPLKAARALRRIIKTEARKLHAHHT